MSALDAAHAAMQAAPENDAARLGWFMAVADSELLIVLDAELAEGKDAPLQPRQFELSGGPVVLAYDGEDRLAAVGGGPYAALPGRALIAALAGQGLGVALNVGAGHCEAMLSPAELEWMAGELARMPVQACLRPESFHAPSPLPEGLLARLDAKFARAGALASGAVLAGVRYEGGGRGQIVAFLDAVPAAEPVLARSVAEALQFSGLEAAALDVVFLRSTDSPARSMARVGLRIDLPAVVPAQSASKTVGEPSHPRRPPRLR